MTLEEAIDRLALPATARVNRRIAKKLLVEKSPRTFRKAIEQGIEQVQWVAVLKPATCALAAGAAHLSGGAAVQVDELSVLTLTTRDGARVPALVEAVHRAVLYHVLLWVHEAAGLSVSTAWKRPSLAHAEQVVLAGEPQRSPRLPPGELLPHQAGFVEALAVTSAPVRDLAALYQRWSAAVLGAQVAEITGDFALPASPADVEERRTLLDEHQRLTEQVAGLARELRRATQVRDRVDLSTRLKRAEQDLAHLRGRLAPSPDSRISDRTGP